MHNRSTAMKLRIERPHVQTLGAGREALLRCAMFRGLEPFAEFLTIH